MALSAVNVRFHVFLTVLHQPPVALFQFLLLFWLFLEPKSFDVSIKRFEFLFGASCKRMLEILEGLFLVLFFSLLICVPLILEGSQRKGGSLMHSRALVSDSGSH